MTMRNAEQKQQLAPQFKNKVTKKIKMKNKRKRKEKLL